MPINWPTAVTVAVLKTEVTKLEARVTANEAALTALNAEVAALKAWKVEAEKAVADHWVLREELRARRTAIRLGELEKFAGETRKGLRALFTLFHPDPTHADPDEVEWSDPETAEHARRFHVAVMHWIERLGGRIDLEHPDAE